MADANDSNDFLRVVDFVDDAVIAETDAPAFTLSQFLATGGSGVFLQCPDLEFGDGKLGRQISQFSLGSRQDEKAIAHFLERFISAMAWSNGIGISPDASASSNARMSSSSSNSSRSFSYSSMLITTAIFSPFSLVKNWVGSFISSPVQKVYSRRLEGAITERRTSVGTAPSKYHSSSPVEVTLRTARKASWGMSTWPTRFMRFFPSFCFSRSLRLRVMSPP